MNNSIRSRLFRAFGDWAIARAMRTPYWHLFHDDGRPYMARYWLLRIGLPRGWKQLERDIAEMEQAARQCEILGIREKSTAMRRKASEWREQLIPWIGVRIHHILSSDDPAFHDHPWTFATLILRGGYTEITPLCPDDSVIRLRRYFGAGSLRLVRAKQWHFLELDPETTAWTLVVTFRKVQTWGFLVNGVKVPWRQYLAQRKADKAKGVSA